MEDKNKINPALQDFLESDEEEEKQPERKSSSKKKSEKKESKKQKGKVLLVRKTHMIVNVDGNGVRIPIAENSNKEYKIGDNIEI